VLEDTCFFLMAPQLPGDAKSSPDRYPYRIAVKNWQQPYTIRAPHHQQPMGSTMHQSRYTGQRSVV